MNAFHGAFEILTALMGFVVLALSFKLFRSSVFLGYRRVVMLLVSSTTVFFASEFYGLLDVLLPSEQIEVMRAFGRLAYVSSTAAALYLLLEHARLELSSLRRAADTDALTGLWNQDSFRRVAARLVAHHAQQRLPLALFLLDVDDFKGYNDRYGHEAGNAALQRVAQVVRESVRARDLVGRYGGDEFVGLIAGSLAEALALAERVRAEIAARCAPERNAALRRQLTASIGVAALSDELDSLERLIDAADAAMYRAKRDGRNRVAAVAHSALRVPGVPAPG